MKNVNVAVVGATGLVGRKIVQILEERNFPVRDLRLLATRKSAGHVMKFFNRDVIIEELTHNSFEGIDIALFSAGVAVSREYCPLAAHAGAVAIDNSSAFRMDEDVPLVVPEVNPEQIIHNKGIISNPNCSTIQMVVVLKPLHDRWKIRRVIVSTYQSVTGAGKLAVSQLESELLKNSETIKKFPHPIAYNVLPHIDVFGDNGYSREEMKMVHETRKILGDHSIAVTATCVRVPVIGGHSESVNIEFGKPYRLDELRDVLQHAPGVCLMDDLPQNIYPMPLWAQEKDEVFVGRVRRDDTVDNGLNLWIVSDNLRKGAATNAVQIAECWLKNQ
jgi:aspartate-semialdehyde dehydrogenase